MLCQQSPMSLILFFGCQSFSWNQLIGWNSRLPCLYISILYSMLSIPFNSTQKQFFFQYFYDSHLFLSLQLQRFILNLYGHSFYSTSTKNTLIIYYFFLTNCNFYFRFSLAQTYIEHAKFLPINEELDAEDRILEKVKTEKATNRLKKEMVSVAALERKKKLKDK